jgi:hypothetical protein
VLRIQHEWHEFQVCPSFFPNLISSFLVHNLVEIRNKIFTLFPKENDTIICICNLLATQKTNFIAQKTNKFFMLTQNNEGRKGRQTMFEKFIELYIYFLLFPFSIYNPQQDKRKNMNLQ